MPTASASIVALNAQFTSAHQLFQAAAPSSCVLPNRCRQQAVNNRPHTAVLACQKSREDFGSEQHHQQQQQLSSRRHTLLAGASFGVGVALQLVPSNPAQAALVQFPCAELKNKYILVGLKLGSHSPINTTCMYARKVGTTPTCHSECVLQGMSVCTDLTYLSVHVHVVLCIYALQIRAGESESEAQDTVLTNPAWKTSMAAGLSERGKAQVMQRAESRGHSTWPTAPPLTHTHPTCMWCQQWHVQLNRPFKSALLMLPLLLPDWERISATCFCNTYAQVLRQTIPSMQALGVCGDAGCWLWPSVTQNSYQTAEIVAGVLGVGRSRIVPE